MPSGISSRTDGRAYGAPMPDSDPSDPSAAASTSALASPPASSQAIRPPAAERARAAELRAQLEHAHQTEDLGRNRENSENREVLAAFRQRADAYKDNTERSKAYYHAVLEELGAWLQQQTHSPEIRSLHALQQHYQSSGKKCLQFARDLVKQFDNWVAVPVRMGGRYNKLFEIVADLNLPAGRPLKLRQSGISRPAERLLHAYREIAQKQDRLSEKSSIESHITALKDLSNWLENRAEQGLPIANGLDSLEKLLRHDDQNIVQQVSKAFENDFANQQSSRKKIQSAVTDFWEVMRQSGTLNPLETLAPLETLDPLETLNTAGAPSAPDALSAALRTTEEALLNDDADAGMPLLGPPDALQAALSTVESDFLGSLQGERLDHEVLTAFRQRADAYPGNTERSKAYYHTVLEELGTWLQQQTHYPEIRSLHALQQHYQSSGKKCLQFARDLVKQFDNWVAVPVRMGGRYNKLFEIVADLNLPAGRPLKLRQSGISRPAERLLHAYREIAQKQDRLSEKSSIESHITALKDLSNWLENRAEQGLPIANGLDSLEKLLRHDDQNIVQQVSKAFENDFANQQSSRKKIQSAVTDFWEVMRQSGTLNPLETLAPLETLDPLETLNTAGAPSAPDALSAALRTTEEALLNDDADAGMPLLGPPDALQAALSTVESDFLGSLQGERLDHEVLAAFRQRADAYPDNATRSKAYYHAVLEELGAWLQQQACHPEIRSLYALQQLYKSKNDKSLQLAQDLVSEFDKSRVVPVRMGGRYDRLFEIVADLSLPASRPLVLLPSAVSRPAERLLHAYQEIAKNQDQNALSKDTITGYTYALRALSNWLEDRAEHRLPIANDLDSLEKLLRHDDQNAVQQVIATLKEDTGNKQLANRVQTAVASFLDLMRQSDEPGTLSAALRATKEALLDADADMLPDHPDALETALSALENELRTEMLLGEAHEQNDATSAPASVSVSAPVALEARLSGVRRPAPETSAAETRRVRPRGNVSPPDTPVPFASPRPAQTALQRQLLSQAAAFSTRQTQRDMADENDSNLQMP